MNLHRVLVISAICGIMMPLASLYLLAPLGMLHLYDRTYHALYPTLGWTWAEQISVVLTSMTLNVPLFLVTGALLWVLFRPRPAERAP